MSWRFSPTAFGRSLMRAANAAAARALLGFIAGPGSSVAGNVAVFADTSGTSLADGGKGLPAGAIVGTTDAQTLTNKTISAGSNTLSNIATSMFAANVIDTDVTLAANSNTRLATQAAVKAYADALIAANDAMVFKGVIDCSANPNYPAADRGHTYKVSVAGKIGGGSGPNVEVGDTLICTTDGTAAGTQAAVGANWTIIQVNIDGAVVGPASSVNNRIAIFSGTTGKLLADGGQALPAGTIVGTTDAQTLTNKTLTNPVVGTQANNNNSTLAASTAYVDGGAWTSYTPTLSSISGALGTGNSASGRYRWVGKTLHYQVEATIGASGAGTGLYLKISLPAAATAHNYFAFGKNTTSGEAYLGDIVPSASDVALQRLSDASGVIVNSNVYKINGTYQAA